MESCVSVLVPVYNGEKYILEFLESVSDQTYSPIELVIVDDHSTDQSFKICEKWCGQNRKRFIDIKLYRNNVNLGLSETTNKLMEYAIGEYLFLADQDDVWFPEKVERQTQYMREHENCIISLTDRSVTDANLNVKIKSEFERNNYSIQSMDFDEFIKHRSHGTSANKMCIRGDCKEKLKIPEGILEHDRFIATMAVCMGTIDYIYEPLLLYRTHGANLSGNFCIELSDGLINCFLSLVKTGKRKNRIPGDNKIIERELRQRFGININEYNHRLFGNEGKREPALLWALKMTKKAYENGQIGAWK